MKKYITILIVIFLIIVAVNEPVLAGAGGSIAKAITKSFWGKLVIAAITIIFLPLILYMYITEYIAVRRTQKDLRFLAQKFKAFDWISLRQRIQDVFMRVQAGWDKGDVSEVNEWMDDWYWQNQQYVYLDRWSNEGLKNITKIQKINSIRPIYVSYSGEADAQNSRLVVLIDAEMQDYLVRITDSIVVEGDREFKSVEKVWTFVFINNKWVVQNIEDTAMSRIYIKEANVVLNGNFEPSINEQTRGIHQKT